MSEKGLAYVDILRKEQIQAGLLRNFLENELWAAASQSIDDQIKLLTRQISVLKQVKKSIENE